MLITMKKPFMRQQVGFTLIEVLVAILIFSFGLLGFVGLQARAIQFSLGAEDTNRAALLANDMAATMTMLKTVNTSDPALAARIVTWQDAASSVAAGMPNGQASVSSSGNVATIQLTWRATSASSADQNRYVTQYTHIP